MPRWTPGNVPVTGVVRYDTTEVFGAVGGTFSGAGGVVGPIWKTFGLSRFTVYTSIGPNQSTVQISFYDDDKATLLRTIQLTAALTSGVNHLTWWPAASAGGAVVMPEVGPYASLQWIANAGTNTVTYAILMGKRHSE